MTEHPVHASCVARDGRAVLLIGKSGSGKSDLALRLIDRGWTLVADDYARLENADGRILASPASNIAGCIEVRGIGIVQLSYVSAIPVSLVILLDENPARLPDAGSWQYGGLSIPSFALQAFEASAPIKVEHLLRLYGLALQ